MYLLRIFVFVLLPIVSMVSFRFQKISFIVGTDRTYLSTNGDESVRSSTCPLSSAPILQSQPPRGIIYRAGVREIVRIALSPDEELVCLDRQRDRGSVLETPCLWQRKDTGLGGTSNGIRPLTASGRPGIPGVARVSRCTAPF